MKFDAEKMRAIARPSTLEETEERLYRQENAEWLNTSAKIALNIRAILRRLGISQAELAARMDVSPAQVTKILSGKENLGLNLDNSYWFVTRTVSGCTLAQAQGGRARRVASYVQVMTNEHCAKVLPITIRSRMKCELSRFKQSEE